MALWRFFRGGARELAYVSMASADYTDLAARYRARVIETGQHVSLTEKMVTRPHLDRLIGGPQIAADTGSTSAARMPTAVFPLAASSSTPASSAASEPSASARPA